MNSFPWEQVIIASSTLLAGLLGYILAGANEARRDVRTAKREQMSRAWERRAVALQARHDFQLETLLALQDAVQQMARLTGRAMHFDHMQAREGKATQLPPSLSDEMHQNAVEVNKLRNRVLDPDLRNAIEQFASASVEASLDPSSYKRQTPETVEKLALYSSAMFVEHADLIMDKLGQALRTSLDSHQRDRRRELNAPVTPTRARARRVRV